MKFLDAVGVTTLVQRLRNYFVEKRGYVATDNNFTTAEKNKLSRIDDGADHIWNTYKTYSFTAKTAGAHGYFQITWSSTLSNRPISVYVHTTSISALNGTQFSVVNATTSGCYITYYCPVATTSTISLTIYAYYTS